MVGPDDSREELRNVLASGLFARSVRQERLLRYICEKTLAGEADRIKEYSIAVEALGRGADFDKSTDSTVRFEAHRLRKKLRQHYESGEHKVCILLEPGTYVPRFLAPDEYRQNIQSAPHVDTGPAPAPPSHRRVWTGVAAAAVLLLSGAYAVLSRPNAPVPSPGIVPSQDAGSIRILAGGSSAGYTDPSGRFWSGDSYFDGGMTRNSSLERVDRTGNIQLFENCRIGPAFAYSIPAAPGKYQLRLYFHDPDAAQPRSFDVSINGQDVLRSIDGTSSTGGRGAALIRAFRNVSPDRDGKIHLHFRSAAGTAFVNALELLPMVGNRIQPIRFTARSHAVADRAGNFWAADDFYSGGQQHLLNEPLPVAPDAVLYAAERSGDFSYFIPVPPGRYGVKLLRAEDGSPRTQALHGLEPNAEGQLVLTFSRRKDTAVSAIEVLDETPLPGS